MSMANTFDNNIKALRMLNEQLAQELCNINASYTVHIEHSRTGLPIPHIKNAERDIALHSMIDPQREAQKIVTMQQPQGFCVLLGLGGGYLARELLASPHITGLCIIEHDLSLLRALVEHIDFSDIFNDARVTFVCDASANELAQIILQNYLPSVHGAFTSIVLQSRVNLATTQFNESFAVVKNCIDNIARDYSVQAFFGKRWFSNIVRNLPLVRAMPKIDLQSTHAIITAAGPSLENSFDYIYRSQKSGSIIIASDTSLPALVGSGIIPDFVVSIDCQNISYYHFVKGLPQNTRLVLDLASPNRLARLSTSLNYFVSGHPLCVYIAKNFCALPQLDTSGGNVTHTAISLAQNLGIQSATICGADFSYPEGKTYARGTYVYDLFSEQSTRLHSLEAQCIKFLFRSDALITENAIDARGKQYIRYNSTLLQSYRAHLELFASNSNMHIEARPGLGLHINIPNKKQGTQSPNNFSNGSPNMSSKDFLDTYKKSLQALPPFNKTPFAYWTSLDSHARELFLTILLTVNFFSRVNPGSDAHKILQESFDWIMAELTHV